MEPISDRTVLSAISSAIYSATYRKLTEIELKDLQRLLAELSQRMRDRSSLDHEVQAICRLLEQSGLFEGKRNVAELDSALAALSAVRARL